MTFFKKLTLLIFLLGFTSIFSQKDSIVTYYNYKNKITNKKSNFKFIQIATKKNDSLWLIRRFRKNGKIFSYWYSKNADKTTKIGKSIIYNYNDSISSISYYNKVGLRHGKYSSWFVNRNKNIEGYYIDGKKEGAWRYYHYNGKLAAKGFFKKNSLLKAHFFDEKGIKKNKPKDCCRKKAKFKGGIKKFHHKVKNISDIFKINLSGNIILNFIIDINGNINNVKIDGFVPERIDKQIINYIKKIKGWQPAEHLGRKIPTSYSINLTFM